MDIQAIEIIEDTLPLVEVFKDEESEPEVLSIRDIQIVEVWIPGPYGYDFEVKE